MWRDLFNKAKEFWNSLDFNRKLFLIIGLASFLIIFFYLIYLNTRPVYQVLISGLSDEQAGLVISKLEEMNVPYKVKPGGVITVPTTYNVYELRMKLSLEGVLGGQLRGYEILSKQSFGATSFDKQVAYQIALEGELAKSISTIKGVKYARVHLALSPKSYYIPAEESKPKASVLLFLEPGATISPNQVRAIMEFVAGAVQNLAPEDVRVVDNLSRDLSAQVLESFNIESASGKFGLKKEVEKYYAQKVEEKLQRVFGLGAVVVIPDVELNWQKIEQETRQVSPVSKTSGIIVSQQSETEKSYDTQKGGAPGTDSNIPPFTYQSSEGEGEKYSRSKIITNYDFNELYKKIIEDKTGEMTKKTFTVFIDKAMSPIPSNEETEKQIKDAIAKATGSDPTNVTVIFTEFNRELEEYYKKIEAQMKRAKLIKTIIVFSILLSSLFGALLYLLSVMKRRREALRMLEERRKKLEESIMKELKEAEKKVAPEELPEEVKMQKKLEDLVEQQIDDVVDIIRYWMATGE